MPGSSALLYSPRSNQKLMSPVQTSGMPNVEAVAAMIWAISRSARGSNTKVPS